MSTLAGYVRVSHVGSRNGDRFHSPDDQANEIVAWARRRGHEVQMLDPELDRKGTDATRPILRQAVGGVLSGMYAGVVVAYLSRAGRDLRLMLDLWDEVEGAGGTIYFARENIDASTTNGRLQRNILASIAQYELEERRDGFEHARASAVERGIWQRRQTPTGYSKNQETRKLEPDDRADEVREAFKSFLAGTSASEIATRLKMTPSGIRQLMRNRVYLGELQVGEHVNLTAHEPLIDLETFEAVQAKLQSRARPARGNNGPALLAGLVRCTSCGHVMTRGQSKQVVYMCPTQHSGEHCPQPAAITTHVLDEYVEKIALAELERLRVTAAQGDRVNGSKEALARAEAELGAYLSAISVEDVGPAAFQAGARARREAINAARDSLRAELSRRPGLPLEGSGADVWKDLNPHERNTLLHGLLAAVIVRPVGRGRRVPVDERARVLAYGTAVELPKGRGGEARGIVPVPFPDLNDEGVLWVPRAE